MTIENRTYNHIEVVTALDMARAIDKKTDEIKNWYRKNGEDAMNHEITKHAAAFWDAWINLPLSTRSVIDESRDGLISNITYEIYAESVIRSNPSAVNVPWFFKAINNFHSSLVTENMDEEAIQLDREREKIDKEIADIKRQIESIKTEAVIALELIDQMT